MASSRFTVDELVERVQAEITTSGLAPLNGQVQAVPDRRTLRYYTTLGLLDRPLAMRGRQAMYGERHVLQALAIKRLQAEGLGLAAVQLRLAGLPDDELRAVAYPNLPVGARALDDRDRPAPYERSRTAFWAQAPVTAPTDPVTDRAPQPGVLAPAPASELVAAVQLGGGAVVLIPTDRRLSDEDLIGVRAAAAPLISHLRRTGLVDPDSTHSGTPRP